MMKPCRQCGSAPRPVPLAPAWADPRALMAAATYRTTVVNLPMTTVVPIARADPLRIAIGFTRGGAGFGDFRVSPALLLNDFGWVITITIGSRWFDLFTFGPMVNDSWNGFAANAEPLAVIEVYRLN